MIHKRLKRGNFALANLGNSAKYRIFKAFVLFFIFVFSFFISFAQDTLLNGIFYYYNNPKNFLIDSVYSLQYDAFMVHYYTPLNVPDNHFYSELSNTGSASRDLIYHDKSIFNYERQPLTFAPYVFSPSNTKYFQNRKPYTSIAYSTSTNGSQYFDVNFAMNLHKGLNLQTEYFVNYADEDFINSQVMNQYFNVSLNYISPKGRYRTNAVFDHNRAYILENGGIESDSAFRANSFSSPSSYTVRLMSGWSKWKTSEYAFSQFFRISKDSSSVAKTFNLGAIVHAFSFGRYARLYDDEDSLAMDSLGMNITRNSLFWTNDINTNKGDFFVPLSIGMNIDFVNFNDTVVSTTYSIFAPEIKTGIVVKNLDIRLNYSHFITNNIYDGDYNLDITAQYSIDRLKNLYILASFNTYKRTWDYIFSHYHSYRYDWNYESDKMSSSSFALELGWNRVLRLIAKISDIDNYVSFDTNLNCQVFDGGKIFQVGLFNDFAFGNFRFKGMVMYQDIENDFIHLPKILFKQSVAFSFSMFNGKMKPMIGVDVRYYSRYFSDMYSTQIGMFTRQNNEQIGNYIYTDLFLNLNISRFCIYAILQHPYAGAFGYEYFNTPLYPAEGFTFRYGITWKLLD